MSGQTHLVKEFIHTLQKICLFSCVVGNVVEVLANTFNASFKLNVSFTLSAIRVDIDLPISWWSRSMSEEGVKAMKMNLTGRQTSVVLGIITAFASLTKATVGFEMSGNEPTRLMEPSVPGSRQERIPVFDVGEPWSSITVCSFPLM